MEEENKFNVGLFLMYMILTIAITIVMSNILVLFVGSFLSYIIAKNNLMKR